MVDQGKNIPQLITANDLARLLNVGIRSIWRMNNAGHIPLPIRLGHSVRWNTAEVYAWMNAGCPQRKKWTQMHSQ